MCDFVFVLGIVILKIILSNSNALSIYLQGKSVNVVSAKVKGKVFHTRYRALGPELIPVYRQ